jgi:hypothetical protein
VDCFCCNVDANPAHQGKIAAHSIPRYNLGMSRTAAEILEEARQLPAGELEWLVQNLLYEGDGALFAEAEAAWRKAVGEPEPGYDEWFRTGVEEAMADTSPGIPHEEVMREMHQMIAAAREARSLKVGV